MRTNFDPDRLRRPPGRRTLPVVAALVAFAVAMVAAPPESRAEQVRMPRIGQQFFALGLSLQPGFMYDETAPAPRRWRPIAATGAGTLRAGLHQIVSERLIMSAEADFGVQWLNEHTAETSGRADSEAAVGWQLAFIGRWLPAGERRGWSLGGGPHLYTVYLADQPLQSLGFDLKAGRYIWRSSENFLALEIGYAIPFIQGLSGGNSLQTGSDEKAPKNWTFHRFSLSLQYGF